MSDRDPKRDARQGYVESVAPEALELYEDRIRFPGAVLLPITVRARNLPGMPGQPWGRIRAGDLLPDSPGVYSAAVTRLAPDLLRGSLRARRTLFEGFLLALSEKTGRRPSRAEQAADAALDEAESRLALGDPAFRAAIMTGIYAPPANPEQADRARRALETRLRARGFFTQRLVYVAERSLHHFQPGGELFPGLQEPVLMAEDCLNLLPLPERQFPPPPEAVWLGEALRDGRDVFFSPLFGFDADAVRPPHATTLILGEMGSGKTSLMRLVLLQRLLQGRRIFSLDPEGENNRLCLSVGGRVVPAGQPEDPGVCLLHPLEAGSPGEMLFAVRFLVTALGEGKRITAREQAAVHDAVQALWSQRCPKKGDRIRISLSALLKALEEAGLKAGDVPLLLHPFSAGGLWDGFFDRPRALLGTGIMDEDVSTGGSPWWNFDLSGLQEETRAIVHALLAWFLYRVVAVARAPVDVFLDEGWRLLRNPTFAGMLDELGRRARKRGMGVTLATHLPEDLASRPGSLGLASTAFVGRLAPAQAEGFLAGLGVPAQEAARHAERIGQLPPHVFYAVPAAGRGSLFPLRVVLPPDWLARWW